MLTMLWAHDPLGYNVFFRTALHMFLASHSTRLFDLVYSSGTCGHFCQIRCNTKMHANFMTMFAPHMVLAPSAVYTFRPYSMMILAQDVSHITISHVTSVGCNTIMYAIFMTMFGSHFGVCVQWHNRMLCMGCAISSLICNKLWWLLVSLGFFQGCFCTPVHMLCVFRNLQTFLSYWMQY